MILRNFTETIKIEPILHCYAGTKSGVLSDLLFSRYSARSATLLLSARLFISSISFPSEHIFLFDRRRRLPLILFSDYVALRIPR